MSKRLEKRSGKVWFRHKSRGELGFLTEQGGSQYIEIDRGHGVVLKPYSPADWIPEEDLRLMTEWQVVQVAWAADRELNKVLRWEPQALGREWLDLKPKEKRQWRDSGPEGEIRRRLFNCIRDALISLTRE